VQHAISPSRTRTRLLAVGLALATFLLCGGPDTVSAQAANRAHRHTTAATAKAKRSQRKRCHGGRGHRSKRACAKSKRAGGAHTPSGSGSVVAKPRSTEGASLSIQSAPPSSVLTSQGSSGLAGGSGSPEGAPGPASGSEGDSNPASGTEGGSGTTGGGAGSSGGSSPPEPPSPEPSPPEPPAPFRFFASTSFWNEPVPAAAPLDPDSAPLVGELDTAIAAEEQAGDGPWINTTSYSYPIYTVPANQPTVRVQLTENTTNAALSSAWSAVPLPPNAKPAVGTDGDLVVWQPSTDRLWEFWRLTHEAEGWRARWGGAIQHVSSNPGVYGPEAWPGAQTWWGTSASSMSAVGGLITLEDLKRGEINHALAIALPERRAGVYASPAKRSDGKSTNPLSLPEGAHLRLNPSLNLTALHLPRLTLMLAQAAQRYGIVVTDGSGVAAGFYAQDPTPTGTNPYTGPGGYFEGTYPSTLLASFPWSQLELLQMELHSSP
jgi:hypothetical protein